MPHPTLDDYTLAAFLSDSLAPEARRSVVSRLLRDDDARDLLHMACEALAAAFQREEPAPRLALAARPALHGADRPALRYEPHPRSAL